jgi:hypothetical protein
MRGRARLIVIAATSEVIPMTAFPSSPAAKPAHARPDRQLDKPAPQVLRQLLYGFTDFQQSDPDGIEYQAVGQVTSLQMGADGSMAARMSAGRCRSR